MEDLQSRRLEALAAHIGGLEAALSALDAEGSLNSVRRLARSLARTADDVDLPEVAARARAVRARDDTELAPATRAFLDWLAAQKPARPAEVQHVLVVEDNRTVAAALLAYLKAEGRVVHLAETAGAAERILAEHPIDLLVLDLLLPDRDGRDLLLQLREDPATAGVPVIVLSARAGTVTRAECLAVGASEFLEKPADPKVLRSTTALLLSEHRRNADARRDAATGTLSRAGLNDAHRALRSRSGKVEGPLAVAVVTVESWDGILRSIGRRAGDRVLRSICEHLRASLGERDELGRWSETELLALCPGTSTAEARGRIETGLSRLVMAAQPKLELAGIELSFACGVSVAESGADLREAALAAAQSQQRGRSERGRITFAPEPQRAAGPPRVLLVEDDRVTATLIQHRLVREGFDVMDFLNGEDAYRWARDGAFDLAILDVKVPGMDGFEILKRLRQLPRHGDVPIIMLTALGSEADVVRGLELGANDYMLKPFSPAELLARVRRLAAEAAAG